VEVDKNVNIRHLIQTYRNNPDIEYIEPHYIGFVESIIPNDPLYTSQQYLEQIHAPEAWDITQGTSDIIIGILDTGVDWKHEDLKNSIWHNPGEIAENGIDDDNNGYIDDIIGWDFVDGIADTAAGEDGFLPDNDPMDFDGHGTHIAGIAAATTNNDTGVAAVSWGARIMPLRCGWHASDGNGYVSSVFAAEAYTYAADNGAHIVNQSSGNSGQLIVDAALYAFLNNVLITESAGNSNAPTPSALGSQFFVMSVASVNDQDQKATYSSFGSYVDISAPGGDLSSGTGSRILSTFPENQYRNLQGTSMAAPVVASVAALVKAHEPNLTSLELYTRLVETADNIDNLNPDYIGQLGAGRVNAYRALTEYTTPKPQFTLLNVQVDDQTANGNGIIEPGENFSIQLHLRNFWENAANVIATLQQQAESPLSIDNNVYSVGNVPGVKDTANWNTSVSFQLSCEPDALPQSVPFVIHLEGDGGFSQDLTFQLTVLPQVLLVDDDDGVNNVEGYYTKVLDEYNIGYVVWNHSVNGTPPTEFKNFPVVIWLCEWTFPSLDATDRAWIKDYLNLGGRLFLSGQDIGWDLGAIDGTEYTASGGASKDFLNNYLHADFILDDSKYDDLTGVVGDPIGDGLTFDVKQPGRTRDQQFPDEIAPLNGAISIFEYPNKNSGAIRYEGDYRLVYFAFGGYEAIVDSMTRKIVLSRVLNWLNGLSLDHSPMKDTEKLDVPYKLSVAVHSEFDGIQSAALFWKKQEEGAYHKIIMQETSSNQFEASIPPAQEESDISYFFFVITDKGTYLPKKEYRFHVGPDTIPPVLSFPEPLPENRIDLTKAIPLTLQAIDNLGLYPDSVYVHYWRKGEPEMRHSMEYMGNDIYVDTLTLDPLAERAGLYYFYFSAMDSSLSRNITISDTFQFSDTTEFVDGFEEGLDNWDTGKYWDVSSSKRHSGKHSISDSKIGDYKNNLQDTLRYLGSFDLSHVQSAWIEYYIKYDLEKEKDFLYLDVSPDNGKNWFRMKSYTGRYGGFALDTLSLMHFIDEETDSLTFRFIISTDSVNTKDGVYIDDISIFVSNSIIVSGIDDHFTGRTINKYFLKANYPNPFNPSTVIEYGIASTQNVTLEIYNILGQRIKTLVSQQQKPGIYRVIWDGTDQFNRKVAAGIYLYHLSAGEFVETRKMILVK